VVSTRQHSWIMHRLAGLVTDCARIAPLCPYLAVDSHDPARLKVAPPLRNQPNKPLLLIHDHHAASSLAPSSHRNLHIASVLRRSMESAGSTTTTCGGGQTCTPRVEYADHTIPGKPVVIRVFLD
jgi:hypothetical protein